MKPWHLVVTGLYLLLLATLAVPLLSVGLGTGSESGFAGAVFRSAGTWITLGVLACCQLVLLTLPVRIAERRPVSRGALWPTILLGATSLALLTAAAAVALHGAILGDNPEKPWELPALAALVAFSWLLWAFVFRNLSGKRPASDFLSVLCRRLFQGSVLELLVAVPCHVVVRQRQDCCAGIYTTFGLGLGVSVMLLSFGPAVYFLFVARARRLEAALPVDETLDEPDAR